MRTFGNIIWHFPFFGFISAIFVYLFGALLTVTVVAAPIGLGLMELGKLLFAPFGKVMIDADELNLPQNKAWKAYSTVIMVLYLPFGALLAFLAVIQTGLLFLSIIGIPLGMVVAKALSTYLNPVGKKCVSSAVAAEIERRKAEQFLNSKDSSNAAHVSTTSTDTPPQTIFCSECGKKNPLQARFCGGCGKQFPQKMPDSTVPKATSAEAVPDAVVGNIPIEKSGSRNIVWILVGVLTIAVAGVFLLKHRNAPTTEPVPVLSSEEPAPIVEKVSATPPPVSKLPESVPEPLVKEESPHPATAPQKEVASAPVESVQKPDVVKQPPKKVDQVHPRKVQKPKPEYHEEAHPVAASQPSSDQAPQSTQPREQQVVVQPAAMPPVEQPKKHHGLRGLIEQATGVDPGSGTSEHQCSDGEKAMHANGC